MPRKQQAEREITSIGPPPEWAHQKQTIAFCALNERVLDTSDPGTGKTRAHLQAYANRSRPRGRLLIICPKTLMKSAWGNDIEKYTPQLTASYAYAEQREEAFVMRTDVVIMNHDGVKWLADKTNHRRLMEFDHVIIDEITAFKHASSQRSKAMAAIRKYFKYRAGLTGTPNPNSVMELWHPMLILDDGKRLGNSYYSLRSKVQIPTQIGPEPNHLRWDDKPGAAQAINEVIGDMTVRHAFADVMKHVPPNYRHVKNFDLSPKAMKLYNKLVDDSIAAFDDRLVTAVHAAALRVKLLQVASGAVYTSPDDDGSDYVLVDTTRYELIADLIEEREHSVVFFNWRHQRIELERILKARGLTHARIDGSVTKRGERDRLVDEYQGGKYRAMLLHPKTGAHGLTLTRGTGTIFSSPIYEADLLEQGIARIVRGTQDQITDTIFVEANNTVEAQIRERRDGKSLNMHDLLGMMRNRSKA